MTTLTKTEIIPEPVDVKVTPDTLTVELMDGRTISAPLVWFPRLLHGSPQERAKFELGRVGIHWPDLDEDIPVQGLLRGEKSGESMQSLKRWLDYRARGKKVPVPTLALPVDTTKRLVKGKPLQLLKKAVSPQRRRGRGG
jgi:hypothetical protein